MRHTITVETSQQRTFRAFTEGMDRWWPRGERARPSPRAQLVVEPVPGGRWYAIDDGRDVELGTIEVWQPPRWVEIALHDGTTLAATFVAEGPRRTRVEIGAPDALPHALDGFAAAAIANKFLMTYECTPAGLAKAPLHIAAHIARLDEFRARGTLLMAGPAMDGSGRAFGVFWSREAADEFIAGDPFVTEGVVDKATVIEWREALE